MEISTTTSHASSEAKVTSHYWGYRELTAAEVSAVAGGDIGDYGNGGDRGFGDSSSSGSSGGGASCSAPNTCAVAGAIAGGLATAACISGLGARANTPSGQAICSTIATQASTAATNLCNAAIGNLICYTPTGVTSNPMGDQIPGFNYDGNN